MSVTSLTVQPLRPYAAFTDGQGHLTPEGYSYLYNIYLRLGGSLSALNAVTLADATWDSPNPIGSTTPSTGKFTTLEATSLKVTSGVTQGAGLKHARKSTGSIAVGTTTVVHTWTTAFPDANYTVVATMQDATASILALALVHIESYNASTVTLRVNNTSAGAITGTIHLIAMHD